MAVKIDMEVPEECTFPDCPYPAHQLVMTNDKKKCAAFCDRHIESALYRWTEWEVYG